MKKEINVGKIRVYSIGICRDKIVANLELNCSMTGEGHNSDIRVTMREAAKINCGIDGYGNIQMIRPTIAEIIAEANRLNVIVTGEDARYQAIRSALIDQIEAVTNPPVIADRYNEGYAAGLAEGHTTREKSSAELRYERGLHDMADAIVAEAKNLRYGKSLIKLIGKMRNTVSAKI